MTALRGQPSLSTWTKEVVDMTKRKKVDDSEQFIMRCVNLILVFIIFMVIYSYNTQGVEGAGNVLQMFAFVFSGIFLLGVIFRYMLTGKVV